MKMFFAPDSVIAKKPCPSEHFSFEMLGQDVAYAGNVIETMVKHQLIARGICDPGRLEAMGNMVALMAEGL